MSAEKPLVSDAGLGRFVKVSTDLVLPGFTDYVERNYTTGLIQTALGVAAGAAVGPWGFLLVGVNSASRSLSGRGLLSHVMGVLRDEDHHPTSHERSSETAHPARAETAEKKK